MMTWKDKILDYEIETESIQDVSPFAWHAWKDKILDYEIETCGMNTANNGGRPLEKIRFSITRLKLKIIGSSRFGRFGQSTWKDKILDYEIETSKSQTKQTQALHAWKDKILDYEIETLAWYPFDCWRVQLLEKIRFSITRLKLKYGEIFWVASNKLEKIRFSITRLKP